MIDLTMETDMLAAGTAFPHISLPTLGSETRALGIPEPGTDWQMVVVYRGLHCPICKTYLAKLESLADGFREIGVGVIAVSGDPEAKARTMAEEVGLTIPVAYGLSVAQMRELGLYVSDPRSAAETDRPFPEPGLFVVNADGHVQIVDISNAPFARPDLERVLSGVKFVRDKDYPIRGRHAA